MVNCAVLVPTYDNPLDAVTLDRLRPCFPDREVLGIPSVTLIRQYESLHCATMQLPVGVLGENAGSVHN